MEIASVLKVFSDSAPQQQEGTAEKCCFIMKPSFSEPAERWRNAVYESSWLGFDKWDGMITAFEIPACLWMHPGSISAVSGKLRVSALCPKLISPSQLG